MKKKSAMKKKYRLILAVGVILLLLMAFCAYFYFLGDTSTGYRFGYKLGTVLEKYEEFSNVLDLEESFPIPGLRRTNVTEMVKVSLEGEIQYETNGKQVDSYHMIPQGLCFAGDYIIISAYDGKARYHSVLYVLDLETRQYLTTIVLEDKNHVGGITFDGENVWIAKSGDNALSRISYVRVDKAVSAGQDSIAVSYDETCSISCRASFVTYYDKVLWVGVFEMGSDNVSVLRGFSYEKMDGVTGLFQKHELFLPELSNGAAIQKINGRLCLIVDASHGRRNSSGIFVYELHMEEDNFENAVCELKSKYIFPPMVEEVEFYGDYIYFIFESAATKYSMNRVNRCKYPVDRVCAVRQDKLLSWTQTEDSVSQMILDEEENGMALKLSYKVSTSRETGSIPAYVYTGKEKTLQMLYNPYAAKIMFNIMQDTDKIGNSYVVGVPSWNDTLSKHGYSNLQSFRHKNVEIAGGVSAGVSVVAGIMRKQAYNNQEKFNIIIGIRAEDIENIQRRLTGAECTYSHGVCSGFYDNAALLYQKLESLSFDVPILQKTENGAMIQYTSMRFPDIVEEMKKAGSRFTISVTGSGIGGGIANVLAGIIFPAKGIYEGNYNCYTFGSLGVAEKNFYTGTNIYNVLNVDDSYCELLGNTVLGQRLVYYADEAFKIRYYGMERRLDFAETAHSMHVYEGILEKLEEEPSRYAAYNTECPVVFSNLLSIDRDCYASFERLVSNSELVVEEGACLFIGRDLTARRLKVYGEMEVHGSLSALYVEIENGMVSVDDNCIIDALGTGTGECLRITGDGRLEINGSHSIPYFRYTRETENHIYYFD